jgi:hypothetical protein
MSESHEIAPRAAAARVVKAGMDAMAAEFKAMNLGPDEVQMVRIYVAQSLRTIGDRAFKPKTEGDR